MVNARFVPPQMLIEALAEYLRDNVEEVKPPEWAAYVKTGSHKERVPDDPEWWYKRCASILRKVYLEGPVGVERLRTYYGGRKNMGTVREHFRKAGGAILRNALQQLEKAGLVKTTPRGRVITDKGRSVVDKVAAQVFRQLAEARPELKKYVA